MTIIVFPAGYFADKFSRDKILKIAGILGFFAMIVLGIGPDIFWIVIALFLWGAFQGLSRPAFESIIADSLPTGNRSKIYSQLQLTRQSFLASGPFLNIFLFHILENKWDMNNLHIVMLVGVFISLLSTAVLFFFRDDRSMGEESESLYENSEKKKLAREDHRNARLIPILLVTSNLIIGMGAGMTIKFFPVFFRSIYDLKPISVQAIMGLTFISTGITSIIAQKLSRRRGRGEMIFSVQLLATICLVIIALYPPLVFLIPLFVMRGSLMNAAHPLSRSILMDVVPKKNRGKWNSLETIAWGLFWNASAVFGGFLIGENNFKLCFLITAGIYFVGTIPIFVMIPMVKKET